MTFPRFMQIAPLMADAYLANTAGQRLQGRLAHFPMVKQSLSQWCWAAVASGVDNVLGAGRTQCDIAKIYAKNTPHDYAKNALKGLTCPPDAKHDTPGYLGDALTYIGLAATPSAEPISDFTTTVAKARAAIASGKPFPIRIDWQYPLYGAHVIAIVGVDSATNGANFLVYDPSPDKEDKGHLCSVPAQAIANNYDQAGRWVEMYPLK